MVLVTLIFLPTPLISPLVIGKRITPYRWLNHP